MKKQIIKQNELALRPLIILAFKVDKYNFINISNVPAMNIRMDRIYWDNSSFNIFLDFDPIDVISMGEEKEVIIRNEKGITADDFDTGFIWPSAAKKSFDFTIRYCNIENKEYLTFGKMGKGGVEIRGTKII